MIRFVPIPASADVIFETRCFAWFDTITDHFLTFNDDQVWENWKQFEDDFFTIPGNRGRDKQQPLSRFRNLYPKDRP